MDIVITESQLRLLEAYVAPQGMKDQIKDVEKEKADLEDYIEAHGEYMMDVTNGKMYMVQYLKALSELVGSGYAMCAPVRSDGTYGAFYVKPYRSFRKHTAAPAHRAVAQTARKPNLFQRMGLSDI